MCSRWGREGERGDGGRGGGGGEGRGRGGRGGGWDGMEWTPPAFTARQTQRVLRERRGRQFSQIDASSFDNNTLCRLLVLGGSGFDGGGSLVVALTHAVAALAAFLTPQGRTEACVATC